MQICFLCQRIIEIRRNQGKEYFGDLCPECRRKVSVSKNRRHLQLVN